MPKGHTNNPGGRPKGVANKKTSQLMETAKRLNCDPFEVLCHFTNGDYKALGYEEKKLIVTKDTSYEEYTISPELRQKSAKDASEYLYPKRKAVEHTFNPHEMDDDELIESTKEILKSIKGAL